MTKYKNNYKRCGLKKTNDIVCTREVNLIVVREQNRLPAVVIQKDKEYSREIRSSYRNT